MPDSSQSHVFVTGAATAVGREVVRQLVAAGYAVCGAADGSTDGAQVRADGALPTYPDPLRAGELRSAIHAAEASIVVHLEPQRHNLAPFARPTWNAHAIQAGAHALIEAAKAAGVQHIVIGSALLAGADTGGDHPPMPDVVALIEALRAAETAALESGIPACVLRLGYAYGAHSADLLALKAAIQTGRPISAGARPAAHGHADHHGAQAGFIHAQDAAAAVVKAVQGAISGQTLDIVTALLAPAAFADQFAAAQGLTVASLPSAFSRLPAALNPAAKLQAGLLALHLEADSAPAHAALAWTPRFASVQAGIDDVLLSWRAAAV